MLEISKGNTYIINIYLNSRKVEDILRRLINNLQFNRSPHYLYIDFVLYSINVSTTCHKYLF